MTFAQNFAVEITGQSSPIHIDDEQNPPETLFLGGVENIAENCNWNGEFEEDEAATPNPDGACGTYYFKDGSKAGLRVVDNKWDAWEMKT